jgi:hypothetical protein
MPQSISLTLRPAILTAAGHEVARSFLKYRAKLLRLNSNLKYIKNQLIKLNYAGVVTYTK